MNNTYHVRIRRNEFELELQSSDKNFIEQKLKELFTDTEHGISKSSSGKPLNLVSSGKRVSLNEFINKVHPESATEYTVALAYYLEKIEGVQEVTVKDVKEGFRKVKFAHSNPSQALISAKIQGFLMRGSDLRHFTVTQTGEKWIEEKTQTS